jgi:uncharacterized membrane protein
MKKTQKKKGGSKKHGRNKRAVDQATSLFTRGKITYEQYKKMKGGE